MPPPKTPSRAPAKPASTTTTAAASSAILHSAFSPASSQWPLFASVVLGLDAQRLRIHEVSSLRLVAEHSLAPKEQVVSLDWGLLAHSNLDSSAGNTTPGAAAGAASKKRRRTSSSLATSSSSTSTSSVVAFGTNTGSVRIYSPAEDKILATLEGQHDRSVVDIKFTSSLADEIYTLGADGKLCRWDVKSGKCIKAITLPSAAVSTLSRPVPSNPSVLAASQTPFLVNFDAQANSEPIVSFAAMKNTIHTILPSSLSSLSTAHFLAADSDRYINLFDIEKRKLLGNLVASKEIESMALHTSQTTQNGEVAHILAALTRDGTVEFFTHPFSLTPPPATSAAAGGQQSSRPTLKSLRKSQTRRCTASLIIRRPNTTTPIPLISAQFTSEGDLVVAYVENGVIPVFEKIKVVAEDDAGEIAWTGKKEVVREKINSLAANVNAIDAGVNGVAGREVRVDESRTVVESGVAGNDGMDIDSESDSHSDENESESDSEKDSDVSDTEMNTKETPKPKTPSKNNDAMDVDNAENSNSEDEDEEEDDDNAEPTFGDLIKSHEVVDVEATLANQAAAASASANGTTPITPTTTTTAGAPGATSTTATTTITTALTPTALSAKPNSKKTSLTSTNSGLSLANVLSQALKTNDNNLLESCFHTTDTAIVRATIQRIDSALAATLLQRLAERLSTRPGRYGHLLVWVQWTCVAHGGSIAGKPGMLRQLADVFKVMEQRSASLAPLLVLKGKLDMLDAQLGLRRALRGEERRRGEEEMEDEENVIYVEGMEDVEGDDDDEDDEGRDGRLLIEEARTGATPAAKKLKRKRDAREAGLTDADLEMFSDEDEAEESGDAMPLTVNDDVDSDDSENEEGSSDEELLDTEAEVSGEEDVSEDEESEEEDDEDEDMDMDGFINDDVSEEEEEESEEEEKPKKKSSKKGKGGR